jgi:hypothetical protein
MEYESFGHPQNQSGQDNFSVTECFDSILTGHFGNPAWNSTIPSAIASMSRSEKLLILFGYTSLAFPARFQSVAAREPDVGGVFRF